MKIVEESEVQEQTETIHEVETKRVFDLRLNGIKLCDEAEVTIETIVQVPKEKKKYYTGEEIIGGIERIVEYPEEDK
mgnify:FL=1